MEVLVDNRDGNVWQVPVESLNWKTDKIGKAGSLDLKLINDNPLENKVVEGSIIRATDGNQKIFYGYTFKDSFSINSSFSVTAYDQLKYLMYDDTFVMPAMTADQAIAQICKQAGIAVGTFEKTSHTVPAMVEDGKKAFDVTSKYLDSTLIATNRNYVLYDNFGKVDLKNIGSLIISPEKFYIGEESLLYDFDYERSIEDSYNRIKLVRDNKETSKRQVYIAQDSGNIAKWGRLQYFEKVNENMTDAQIKKLLDALLEVHNTVKKKLSLKCLGNWLVRAGVMVYVYIKKIGIKQLFLVESCSHDWKSDVHTMSLELKVI